MFIFKVKAEKEKNKRIKVKLSFLSPGMHFYWNKKQLFDGYFIKNDVDGIHVISTDDGRSIQKLVIKDRKVYVDQICSNTKCYKLVKLSKISTPGTNFCSHPFYESVGITGVIFKGEFQKVLEDGTVLINDGVDSCPKIVSDQFVYIFSFW